MWAGPPTAPAAPPTPPPPKPAQPRRVVPTPVPVPDVGDDRDAEGSEDDNPASAVVGPALAPVVEAPAPAVVAPAPAVAGSSAVKVRHAGRRDDAGGSSPAPAPAPQVKSRNAKGKEREVVREDEAPRPPTTQYDRKPPKSSGRLRQPGCARCLRLQKECLERLGKETGACVPCAQHKMKCVPLTDGKHNER